MRRASICLLLALSVLSSEEGYEDSSDARLGAWTGPVPLIVQADVGTAPGEGQMVWRVRPGSTAESLGVQPGDVIVALAGRPIDSRRDLREVMYAAQAGDPLSLTVRRGTAEPIVLQGDWAPRTSTRPRRPLPSEDWERAVQARQEAVLRALAAEANRQRQILAEAEQALSALPPGVAALEPERLARHLRQRPPQDWSFSYAWQLDQPLEF